MAIDKTGPQIEALIRKGEWQRAQAVIEKQLKKEPADHWLWSRLAGVKYEQRNYQESLEDAERAVHIVPDCPLALWSKAGALAMLGKYEDARSLYARLIRRGLEELKNPDTDADECWEGADWTAGLVADCIFRNADCWAKLGDQDRALESYQTFLGLTDLGAESIYSREDALGRLNKLVPSKKARRAALIKAMGEKELMGTRIGLLSGR